MIATKKSSDIRPEMNYVQIKDGWATWTNAFVMFRKGITTQDIPEIYISVDEWKKVEKYKKLNLIAYKDGIATFIEKGNRIDCIATTDINFPDVNKLEPKKTIFKVEITLSTLELLIKQTKLDGKFKLSMEFTDEPLSKITGTEHLFTVIKDN